MRGFVSEAVERVLLTDADPQAVPRSTRRKVTPGHPRQHVALWSVTRPDASACVVVLRRTRRWRVLPHPQGYLYVLPAFLILGLFHLWPSDDTFFLSLHNWNFIRRNPTFIGLTNYERLWADEYFAACPQKHGGVRTRGRAAEHRDRIVLGALIDGWGRLSVMYRVLLFTPVVTAASAASVIWTWMYAPGADGFFNLLLGVVGLGPARWLQDPDLAMPSVILLGVWKSIGYNVVLSRCGSSQHLTRVPGRPGSTALPHGKS